MKTTKMARNAAEVVTKLLKNRETSGKTSGKTSGERSRDG